MRDIYGIFISSLTSMVRNLITVASTGHTTCPPSTQHTLHHAASTDHTKLCTGSTKQGLRPPSCPSKLKEFTKHRHTRNNLQKKTLDCMKEVGIECQHNSVLLLNQPNPLSPSQPVPSSAHRSLGYASDCSLASQRLCHSQTPPSQSFSGWVDATLKLSTSLLPTIQLSSPLSPDG